LSNTTLGISDGDDQPVDCDQSPMPAIFRGIHLDPLVPQNTSYLLWILLGFMVVMAVARSSVSAESGDMYGRVRMLQPRLRGVHRGFCAAVVGPGMARERGGALVDRECGSCKGLGGLAWSRTPQRS